VGDFPECYGVRGIGVELQTHFFQARKIKREFVFYISPNGCGYGITRFATEKMVQINGRINLEANRVRVKIKFCDKKIATV
jgi:hypothetical protein